MADCFECLCDFIVRSKRLILLEFVNRRIDQYYRHREHRIDGSTLARWLTYTELSRIAGLFRPATQERVDGGDPLVRKRNLLYLNPNGFLESDSFLMSLIEFRNDREQFLVLTGGIKGWRLSE